MVQVVEGRVEIKGDGIICNESKMSQRMRIMKILAGSWLGPTAL
jgi:hypothetical protein